VNEVESCRLTVKSKTAGVSNHSGCLREIFETAVPVLSSLMAAQSETIGYAGLNSPRLILS
jgi:hypothetical protein